MTEIEKLYDDYFESFCKLSYNIIHKSDVAEDIVQDSFIIFYDKKNTIKNKKKYVNWLKRIVINKSIDYFRKYIKKRTILSIDGITENYNGSGIRSVQNQGSNIIEITDRDSNILKRIIEADSTKILNDAIDKLTPRYKEIYKMHELIGIKHKVISKELGICEGTSKSNLKRAKKRLRKILSEYETNS